MVTYWILYVLDGGPQHTLRYDKLVIVRIRFFDSIEPHGKQKRFIQDGDSASSASDSPGEAVSAGVTWPICFSMCAIVIMGFQIADMSTVNIDVPFVKAIKRERLNNGFS